MKKTVFISLFCSVILTCLIFSTPKVSAISDNVLLAQVYLGDTGLSGHEYISIHNKSNEDIDITDWCLQFASTENYRDIVCFESLSPNIRFFINSGEHVLSVSETFATTLTAHDFVFSNSANIPGTNGSIRLVDAEGLVIDTIGWGSGKPEGTGLNSLSNGGVFNRLTNPLSGYTDSDNNIEDFEVTDLPLLVLSGGVYEVEVVVDLCRNIENLQTELPDGMLADEAGNCYEDFCPNLDGLQVVAPVGFEKPIGSENCEEIPLEDSVIFITELLPNPPSYDTDAEFIELYNPNNENINLARYKIQVGPSFSKEYEFTEGVILAGEYLVFNDGITGITLPNSSGVQLRLVAPAGNVVSQTEIYSNAGDDVSWALVDDQWIFTNQITPDEPNKPYLEPAVDEVEGVTTVYAPCPEGKFRNPETNRCKNIESAVSQLTPCDEDEYRNPDTNRCRKISSSSSSLVPCDEGEERNPETNRCRKVSTLGISDVDQLPTVTDIQAEDSDGTINWGIIGIALLGTLGYMVYEWRSSISRAWVNFR